MSFLVIGVATLNCSCGSLLAAGVKLNTIGKERVVSAVSVTPAWTEIGFGESRQFSAQARDREGKIVSDAIFAWSSDGNSVAVVSASGLASAQSAGAVHITASAQGVSASAVLNVVPPRIAQPCSMFGLDVNDRTFPTVNFGLARLWDTPGMERPFLNPAPGVYSWKILDYLALLKRNKVTCAWETLSRTPEWASSNPSDSSCAYFSRRNPTGHGAPGQCWPPHQLNSDGTGSDSDWIAWVRAIAQHVSAPDYLLAHAAIRYWEPWNEFDTDSYWRGTYAQLVRMTEDARCVIKGSGQIHNTPVLGQVTECAEPGIDAGATIIGPSFHPSSQGLSSGSNFLYCNSNPGSTCNTGSAGAAAVDVINVHMKPGANVEPMMQLWVADIQNMLRPEEFRKPLYNGEGGYSSSGWASYSDPDLQAAFLGRYYVFSWSLGIANTVWYNWNFRKGGIGEPAANLAFSTLYRWLSGATLTSPCSSTGTLWSCAITDALGNDSLILWDVANTCSEGICSEHDQIVSPEFTSWVDLLGANHARSGNTVPVGIKPIMLQK